MKSMRPMVILAFTDEIYATVRINETDEILVFNYLCDRWKKLNRWGFIYSPLRSMRLLESIRSMTKIDFTDEIYATDEINKTDKFFLYSSMRSM